MVNIQIRNSLILIIIVSLLFFSNTALSQELMGKVLSEVSGKELPFATVVYKKKSSIGTYADDKGLFKIPFIADDTLMISSVGYVDYQLSTKEYSGKLFEIKLKNIESETLDEVTVVKSYNGGKSRLLGYSHLNSTHSVGATKGAKFLVEIPNTFSNPKQIIELHFVLANASGNNNPRGKGMVRICLYAMDSLCDKPMLNLLKRDIVITVPKPIFSYRLIIDISRDKVFMPSCGVFVGLEFLGSQKESYVYNINPAISYTKQIAKYRKYIEFFGKEKNNQVINGEYPMFGIKIK